MGTLYKSTALAKTYPVGYVTCRFLESSFTTCMRPGELYGLRLKDLSLAEKGEEEGIKTGILALKPLPKLVRLFFVFSKEDGH